MSIVHSNQFGPFNLFDAITTLHGETDSLTDAGPRQCRALVLTLTLTR